MRRGEVVRRSLGVGPLSGAVDRRTLLQQAGIGGLGLALGWRGARAAGAARIPAAKGAAVDTQSMAIDLASEPPTLDPALTYTVDGWSVVHSVYDALVQYDDQGNLEPLLAAEPPTLLDPLTYQIKLRLGVRFHNGEPFDAQSVVFTVAHMLDKKTASQVADNFRVIKDVQVVDPLTVRLHLTGPAPWLPAQMATWLAMLPPTYAAANDFGAKPVGTGPFRFVDWQRGAQIRLEANPDSFAASPKGSPLAQKVTYRIVPEGSTRVADLLAGNANLVTGVPVDQADAVGTSAALLSFPDPSTVAFVRIANDAAPFSDVRVRQALNYAVDVETIVKALLGGVGKRLAGFFPPPGLGYDPALAPYAYDPDKARTLLRDAGHAKGFDAALDYASFEREEIVDAIASQLREVGVRVKVQGREAATFNTTYADPRAPVLRFITWRPMFDPYTLLSLLVADKGYLSRHANPKTQPLIAAGANETDPAKRAAIYRRLGQVLRDEPAAIYLYSPTALYGAAKGLPWSPRADEYVIATKR